jgi:hypothetical protein
MTWLLPHSLARQQVVSLSQSSCVSTIELTEGRGRAKSHDKRESLVHYSSVNILSPRWKIGTERHEDSLRRRRSLVSYNDPQKLWFVMSFSWWKQESERDIRREVICVCGEWTIQAKKVRKTLISTIMWWPLFDSLSLKTDVKVPRYLQKIISKKRKKNTFLLVSCQPQTKKTGSLIPSMPDKLPTNFFLLLSFKEDRICTKMSRIHNTTYSFIILLSPRSDEIR